MELRSWQTSAERSAEASAIKSGCTELNAGCRTRHRNYFGGSSSSWKAVEQTESMKATSIAEVRVWDLLVVFLLWIFAAGFQSWLFASLPF
jgi:hypothetical protein